MEAISNKAELQYYVNSGNPVEYLAFWGHQQKGSQVTKACLSQWYPSPFEVEGVAYFTAEHYMMAEKARLFGDMAKAKEIASSNEPGHAKKLGREVQNFNDALWQEHRFGIVVKGNLAKFSQSEALKHFLLSTGNKVLVEASPVDIIWGIGLAQDSPDCYNPNLWRGENLLGFALMQVRGQLA